MVIIPVFQTGDRGSNPLARSALTFDTMNKDNTWQQLDSKIAYSNSFYSIREDSVIKPDGSKGSYAVMVRKFPAVFIIAVDDKDKICVIGQYRYPTQQYSYEIPGGGTDSEEPLTAARRELQEETGLLANNLECIGKIQLLNGISDEMGFVFIAKQLSLTPNDKKMEEGIDTMFWLSISEILEWIRSGKITDAQSIAALTQGILFLQNKF